MIQVAHVIAVGITRLRSTGKSSLYFLHPPAFFGRQGFDPGRFFPGFG